MRRVTVLQHFFHLHFQVFHFRRVIQLTQRMTLIAEMHDSPGLGQKQGMPANFWLNAYLDQTAEALLQHDQRVTLHPFDVGRKDNGQSRLVSARTYWLMASITACADHSAYCGVPQIRVTW